MTAKRRMILAAVGFLIVEGILFAFVDRPVSEYLRSLDVSHHALIDFFRSWTDFGKSKWYLWPSAIGIVACALLLRHKKLARGMRIKLHFIGEFCLFLFVCVAVAGITTDIIKPLLGRARPVELDRDGLYGFHPLTFDARWNSMPSGHATAAFAFAFIVGVFFPRLKVPVFIVAVALALSRIMVNAHYISDVLAGGMVAFLIFDIIRQGKLRNGMFHIRNSIFPIDDSAPPR